MPSPARANPCNPESEPERLSQIQSPPERQRITMTAMNAETPERSRTICRRARNTAPYFAHVSPWHPRCAARRPSRAPSASRAPRAQHHRLRDRRRARHRHPPPHRHRRWSPLPRPPTSTWSPSAFIPRSRSPRSPTKPASCSTASAPPTAPSASPPPRPSSPAKPSHWTFVYDGTITGNEDGPVEGLKLAAIQEPISYLLYPARWFPTTGYMTDRFTAEMHIRVPAGHARLRQRRHGRVPSPSPSPTASPATSTTSTGPSPAFPEP